MNRKICIATLVDRTIIVETKAKSEWEMKTCNQRWEEQVLDRKLRKIDS